MIIDKEQPKVGITLSGGGARGAAHIGVLRALSEAGIHPAYVVGVSAGAIIGALYAAGRTPDEMMAFVKQSSVVRLIKLGIPLTGLTKLDYLIERLAAELIDDSFSALEKPLQVGVTNLETGAFELRDQGSLFSWVAASCSIPFVFKPIKIDKQLYVDGGVMRNMPIGQLKDTCDLVIGSNLMPPTSLKTKELSSFVSITWRCFDLAVMANTQSSLERCDLLFEPPRVAKHTIFSFGKLQELHDIGYAYAKEVLERKEVVKMFAAAEKKAPVKS